MLITDANGKEHRISVTKPLILLNSRVVPGEGTYTVIKLTEEDVARVLVEFKYQGGFVSYISYPEPCEVINGIVNIDLEPVTERKNTVFSRGQSALAVHLKHRPEPTTKGVAKYTRRDYEFSIITMV